MNIAQELLLTAMCTIMGIVVVCSIIAKFLEPKEEESE